MDGGCVHTSGVFLQGDPDDGEEDPCFDENGILKTSLEELFDEDGPSPDRDGDGVDFDIDGDGYDGEDPPNGPATGALNDDLDCVDTLTGVRLGGLRPGGLPVPDGEPESCFEAGGELRRTLFEEADGCRHEIFLPGARNGQEDSCYTEADELKPERLAVMGGCMQITYLEGYRDAVEDSCYDADDVFKRTTLAELFDEDDGQPVDDDDDGLVDEDGTESNADFRAACEAFGRKAGLSDVENMFTADGGCDLTRAVIASVNKKAQAKGLDKFYKADDEGYPDASLALQGDSEIYEYGTEPRQVVVEEIFTVMCDQGMVLDTESGQCVREEQAEALAAFRDGRLDEMLQSSNGSSVNPYTLMGFTFAPPRVRWGIFYKEELDLALHHHPLRGQDRLRLRHRRRVPLAHGGQFHRSAGIGAGRRGFLLCYSNSAEKLQHRRLHPILPRSWHGRCCLLPAVCLPQCLRPGGWR
jgi:hypothetical protein